ncbi:MAG TPA: NYN domain-containing protein [Oculatellaceae cyanobacterium]
MENIKIDANSEKFLSSICQYKLQVKIAFANWRSTSLSKHDTELYERGYQLIHVPGGKDSADAKMLVVGSSIFMHYPNIKEVFICSDDLILTHLCNQLQNQGLTVYWVRRKDKVLQVDNRNTGKIKHYSLTVDAEIPSFDNFVKKLDSLLQTEQKAINERIVNLSKITTLFQEKCHITLIEKQAKAAQVALTPQSLFTSAEDKKFSSPSTNNSGVEVLPVPNNENINFNSVVVFNYLITKLIKFLGKKLKREFISVNELKREFQIQYKQSPDLIVKQIDNDSSSLIKFFKARSHVFKINLVKSDYQVALAQPNLTDLHSPSDLEQMLINLLQKLQVNPLHNLITIETLESEVYQHYGVTITAIMKYLNLEDSLIEFLKSCKGFQIEKSETSYQVGLA